MKDSKIRITKQINTDFFKYKTVGSLFLFVIISLGLSCGVQPSHSDILNQAKQKIKDNKHASYTYESIWNNKYNDSEFRDTNYIELEQSNNNRHGLVYYTSSKSRVDFFDGSTQKEIDHKRERIINHDADVIASDSTYFTYRMNLMAQPTHFLKIDSTYKSKDSIIEGNSVVIYSTFEDEVYESKKIRKISSYVIDKNTSEPWIIKTTGIMEKDTTQILTHYFQDISLSNKSIDFDKVQQFVPELGYAEITPTDMMNEMAGKQIHIGAKIQKNKYENMLEEETTLFGRPGKKTVLMLSFIGCGGCEYAMKEMKKKNFEFKDDIDFYYSSPSDKSAILKTYLPKKGFEGIGFGKESNMNETFNAFSFPTFFVIDSSGTIADVYHGYRDGFEDVIF